jgi:hypothetical protein
MIISRTAFSFSHWNLFPALVPFPFYRYGFMEIQDYIKISSVAIALGWTFVFNYLSYLRLKKSDI